MTIHSTKIAFVGMTHLGLVSATGIAAAGFDVLCIDSDEILIENFKKFEAPISEPQLIETLQKNGDLQGFTTEFSELANRDVVYIACDVPTDDEARSDLKPVIDLIAAVKPHINKTAALVILCQVPPGFTRSIDFDENRLFYQVETLVFGIALERAMKPERYIVGTKDGQKPSHTGFVELLSAFNCPILPMKYESAELAKISINVCLVASVTVANTLAELSESIGADWREIVPSLKLDRRIGQNSYLNAGLGIAGGNLERDLNTIMNLSDAHNTDSNLISAMITNSQHRKVWAAKTIQNLLPSDENNGKNIAIWGLAYKENTHSTKNSPSLANIDKLRDYSLSIYDPEVTMKPEWHGNAHQMPTAFEALSNVDALMILTPWPEFRSIDPMDIAAKMNGKIVIDPYLVLDEDAAKSAGLHLIRLGKPVN